MKSQIIAQVVPIIIVLVSELSFKSKRWFSARPDKWSAYLGKIKKGRLWLEIASEEEKKKEEDQTSVLGSGSYLLIVETVVRGQWHRSQRLSRVRRPTCLV